MNGIGVGIFKVHPLIMTLGLGLVILGLMNVYQLVVVTNGTNIPPVIDWLGSGTTLPFLPNNLFLFVPIALLIIAGLRYSGFGRLLFAVGDNPVAARLSGVRAWQVLVGLYILSALLAAVAGILIAGLVKTASLALVDQSVLPAVAAAVIGGTSIMGGRGGYSGTIIGALILTVLTSLLIALQMPEAVRQILFGAIIVFVAAAYTRVDRRLIVSGPASSATVPHLGSTSAGRTSNGRSSSSDGDDLAASSTAARSRPRRPAARTRSSPRLGQIGRRRSATWPGVATAGVGIPGLYDPRAGRRDSSSTSRATGTAGPVAAPSPPPWACPRPDQRRPGVRAGRASARRRARGRFDGGADPRDRRRRRHRHRRPVHQGHDGTAGEIGHQTIDPDGPSCNCGNHGCLEAFARADRIAEACGTATAEEAVERARAGDEAALDGLQRVGRYLGIGIGNMIDDHLARPGRHRRWDRRGGRPAPRRRPGPRSGGGSAPPRSARSRSSPPSSGRGPARSGRPIHGAEAAAAASLRRVQVPSDMTDAGVPPHYRQIEQVLRERITALHAGRSPAVRYRAVRSSSGSAG